MFRRRKSERAFHSIKWNAWNLGQTPFHSLLLIFLIFLLFCCRWGQEEPKRKEGVGGAAIATTRKSIYPRRKKERKEEKKSFYYYQENYVARDAESIYFHNRRISSLSFGLPGLQKRLPTSVYRLIFVEGPHTRNNNRRNG